MLGSNGHKMSHHVSKDYSGSSVSCLLYQLINTVFLVLLRLNIFSNPVCHNISVFPTHRFLESHGDFYASTYEGTRVSEGFSK